MPKEVDAITKLYDFLLWIFPKLEKFPRSQKFLIADRIETVLLDVLDLHRISKTQSYLFLYLHSIAVWFMMFQFRTP